MARDSRRIQIGKGLTAILFFLILIAFPRGGDAQPFSSRNADFCAPDCGTLLAQAREKGAVRVIMKLNVEGSPRRDEIAAAQERLLDRLSVYPVAAVRRFRLIPALAADLPPAALEGVIADPEVARVQEDAAVPPVLSDTIPLIGANNAWAAGYSGAGVAIAVLDTGVDAGHPFLAGKVVSEACYSTTSAANGSTTLCPDGAEEQTGSGAGSYCDLSISGCNHGTHVAGIVAGNGTSFSGVSKEGGIVSIQVFSRFDGAACDPSPSPCILSYTSDQIGALERVHFLRDDFNLAAANLSLGGGRFTAPCDGDARKGVIDLLRSIGIATVVASGNDGYADALSSPACISSAVSVGSTTKGDAISSFSNSASWLSLLAPGGDGGAADSGDIISSIPGSGFGYAAGTSMSAPHVAGAWAVLKSKIQATTVSDILSAFTSTGVSVQDSRNGLTKPRIRVDAAAEVLSSSDPTPPTAPANLMAVFGGPNRVDLSWTASSDNVAVGEYRVERCQGEGCSDFILIAAVTGTAYTDTTALSGIPYTYRVRAIDGAGSAGGYSNAASPFLFLNIGGSSSGTGFAADVALTLFDQTPDPPRHYVNGVLTVPTTPDPTVITAGKLHVWTGTRNGTPTTLRYAATDSSDGITRPTNYTAAPGAGMNLGAGEMHFLDHNAGGCGPFVSTTKEIDVNNNGTIDPGETFTFFEATGCTGGVVKQQVELGASDVHGSSFHQTGGGSVKPLDQSQLDSVQAVMVPFKLVLGKGVKKVNPVTGLLEKAGTLSRLEVEWLLSESALSGNFKWSTLGLVADADGDGVADSPEPNITRCLRAAGSGTKAALDETVMKDANETPLGTTDLTDPTPSNSTYFGKSTQDVQDCVAGRDLNGNGIPEFPDDANVTTGDRPPHPLAIGYLNADALIPDSPAPFGDADTLAEGYDVALNGLHANDPRLSNPKLNIICGKYYYWVGWRLNSYLNLSGVPGVTTEMMALKDAFVTAASTTGVNDFWVKPDEMHVFKNTDKGPILWKAAHVHPAGKEHPSCGYNPPDPKQ